MAVRVLIVNDDEDAERVRTALRSVGAGIGCLYPVRPIVKKVLDSMNRNLHGVHAEYDAVVIEPIDPGVAEEIACAVIEAIPWQPVIIVGSGPLKCEAVQATFVDDMPAVAVELQRAKYVR